MDLPSINPNDHPSGEREKSRERVGVSREKLVLTRVTTGFFSGYEQTSLTDNEKRVCNDCLHKIKVC